MRYVIRSDDLENTLPRSLDIVRRLGLSVSRLTVDVEGPEAALDLRVSETTDAVSNTLRERIALIEGVRLASPG